MKGDTLGLYVHIVVVVVQLLSQQNILYSSFERRNTGKSLVSNVKMELASTVFNDNDGDKFFAFKDFVFCSLTSNLVFYSSLFHFHEPMKC